MDIHTFILDTFCWPFIDRGKLYGQTPLIRHDLGLRNLTIRSLRSWALAISKAERAIQVALAKVDL